MTGLTFPLDISINSSRPIFTAFINGKALDCMLDTGADISVFCKGAGLFQEFIKGMDGVTEFKKFSLGGFGVARENTMLWRFQCFNFSDNRAIA